MALRFSKLDRPALRKLGAGEKITEHGITAERLAAGDLRWSVNVMVDGRRIHRVIGTESGGVTRTQCEEFIEQARSDARAGRLSLPAGRKLALTVTAAADDYVARLEAGDGRNVAVKKRQLRLYIKPFFGAMRLDAVSTFAVGRYKKKREANGAAPATINRELATLSHLFSMALEWKWLRERPCRVKKLEERPGRRTPLSAAECDALMHAAIGSADPYCWLFVAFGLNTAMRHSEILAANFKRLELDNLRLFIPDAKAGQRTQPITAELADLLRRERAMRPDCRRPVDHKCGLETPHQRHGCLTHGGWIFPSEHGDSGTGHRARMDRAFRDAVKAADLDPALVTPHVLRHTAITVLVKAGVDLPTVQQISGHKTPAMVLRYTKIDDPHIDQAIRAIGRGVPKTVSNLAAAPDGEANRRSPAITPEPGSEQELPSNAAPRSPGTTTPELHRAPALRAV